MSRKKLRIYVTRSIELFSFRFRQIPLVDLEASSSRVVLQNFRWRIFFHVGTVSYFSYISLSTEREGFSLESKGEPEFVFSYGFWGRLNWAVTPYALCPPLDDYEEDNSWRTWACDTTYTEEGELEKGMMFDSFYGTPTLSKPTQLCPHTREFSQVRGGLLCDSYASTLSKYIYRSAYCANMGWYKAFHHRAILNRVAPYFVQESWYG